MTDMFDNAHVKIFPVVLILLPKYVRATQCRTIEALDTCPTHDLLLAEEFEKIPKILHQKSVSYNLLI